MIHTSLDILWLVLAGGLGLLLISLTVLVWHLIGSVKRINAISDSVYEIVDLVNTYIKLPASFGLRMLKWWKQRK